METKRPSKGQETKPIKSEQVPCGKESLVPSNETKMEDPQQTKSRRRRKRSSKHVNIIETPIEILGHEPIQEMVEESQKPLETTPQMVPNSISNLNKENWVKKLWEGVCKVNETKENK